MFAPHWHDICSTALAMAQDTTPQSRRPAEVRDVVLTCFSLGRSLMYSFVARAKGLEGVLREVWDFEGTGGPPPFHLRKARALLYDQQPTNAPPGFHVPGTRWVAFHKRVTNVHSNLPDMLAWHAGTATFVR